MEKFSEAADMRKQMDKLKYYEEFLKGREKISVMVSYDCTGKHKPFGQDLYKLLFEQKKSEQINESLYKLPEPLDRTEVISLSNEILELFKKATINESVAEKKSKVSIITPFGNSFDITTIIDED